MDRRPNSSNLSAGRIALGYSVLSILWIAFSDAVVTHLKLHPAVMTLKGAVFVFVTASLLYLTIRRLVQDVQLTSQERDATAELYRTVVEASNEGICLLDWSGRILFLNGRLAGMLGHSAEELQGKRLQDYVEEPHLFAQPAQQSATHEYRLRKNSDRKRWVLISRHPVRNDAAETVQWVGTVIDVTERKAAEQALRESESRFRTFVDHAGDAFFVLDEQQQGKVIDVNRQACESLGYTREELIGMVPQDFDRDAGTALLERIRERIEAGEVCTFETRHQRKDGTTFPVEVRVRPLWHRDHRLHLALARDITERKRTEESLRRSNRELRAISNCNQVLLRASEEQSLLKDICRIVCEEAGYRMAWVGYAEHDEAKTVRPVAWAGAEDGYLATAAITWADTERGCGPAGMAIRSGKSYYTQDYATDPRFAPWRESALQRGFCSGIVLPLKDEHANTFGCLCIYCAQSNAFTPEEVRLLEELADDLAFGIVTLRSRDARKRAEQEVALLSFALDNVREAAFLVDDKGCFHYVNEEACRVLGYTRAELLGLTVPDIDPELPAWRWSDHWRERRKHGSETFESRHRTRDGRIFPVEISANYFEYGSRAYTLALGRDITERKRAEEEVRNVAAQWQATFDAVQDSVLLLDKDFRILRANHAAAAFLGLPLDKVVGRHCYDLTHGTSVAPEECPLAKTRQSRRHEEVEVLAREGGPWLSVSVDPLFDLSGELTQVVHVARDITERKRAEEALRRSEGYLAEAERINHTGSWAWSPASGIQYWSEESFRIMGFDPAEGPPRLERFLEAVHPEDLPRMRERLRRVAGEKTNYETEYRIIRPSGEVRDLRVIGQPVFDSAGNLLEYVGTSTDITERKRAEEALRRSKAYLAEGQRLSHTGSWANDAAAEPVYWSEELFRLYGFDPQDGLPTHAQAIQRVHPEDRAKYVQAFYRLIHQKVDSDVEFRTVLPDGSIRYLYGLGHPVSNEDGELVEVVGTTIDITERKRAEEVLHESETRFRTFVDHATDAFFMLDLEQRIIVDVNQAACESLGYTREELVGTTPVAFHLDSEQVHMQSVAERAAAGEPVFDRHWHRRKDGSVFPVEVQTSVVRHGGRRFLLKVARDITDRVQAEGQREKLRQMEADLAHIHRVSMMGELTASIAHEVNQPLAGVVSNAGACLRWLGRDVPDLEEAREALNRIVRDGKRAGEVIKRIRSMTKRTATAAEKLDLNETIREILVLIGDEIKRNKVMIRTLFADDLAPVSGDRVQIQQVVLNLVMNGIDAMRAVDDRIRDLAIITRNIGADQVQVTIEDSGTGLDPNTMEKIFDPFYTTKPGGMGMGLSICRSILHHHGGRLWASVNDGPGTSFHFILSKYQAKESDAEAAGI